MYRAGGPEDMKPVGETEFALGQGVDADSGKYTASRIAAGIVARKAAERGMKVPSYVKTSLAPGSRVVTEYLEKAGLQKYLNEIGFNLVGYGCTTCIGNSGPLEPAIEEEIVENDIIAASVLSGWASCRCSLRTDNLLRALNWTALRYLTSSGWSRELSARCRTLRS